MLKLLTYLSMALSLQAQSAVVIAEKSQTSTGYKIVYSVINKSDYPIFRIRIGFIETSEFPCPMLDSPPESVNSPTGWNGKVDDENSPDSSCNKFFIEWRGDETSVPVVIPPHSTMTGFSVLLKNDMTCYYNTKFSVNFEKQGDRVFYDSVQIAPLPAKKLVNNPKGQKKIKTNQKGR